MVPIEPSCVNPNPNPNPNRSSSSDHQINNNCNNNNHHNSQTDEDHEPPINQTVTRTATTNSPSMLALAWLRSRRSRYLILLLCSPILLPLLFVSFPFLLATEICIRFCRRIRRRKTERDDDQRRCEEGRCGCEEEREVGLLQRYLEDQLMLVVGSVYECGDSSGGVDDHHDGCTVPLLS